MANIARAFWAYPSRPPGIGETIATACAKLQSETPVADFLRWEQLRTGGKIIFPTIADAIRDRQLFCADLTALNNNVLFELGYAIALQKRLWLILDESREPSMRLYKRLRLLTTLGYRSYSNSDEIIARFLQDAPYDDLQSDFITDYVDPIVSAKVTRRVAYFKTLHETDASIRVTAAVEAHVHPFIDDPNESAGQSLAEFVAELLTCAGAIFHLCAEDRTGADIHNARLALLAGVAHGLRKPTLLILEGDVFAPIDYRELSAEYSTAAEAERQVKYWLDQHNSDFAEAARAKLQPKPRKRSLRLQRLDLGEPLAENEQEGLARYFVSTQAYSRLLSLDRALVVGRKGVGKTAFRLKLLHDAARDKRILACDIAPTSVDLNSLIRAMEQIRETDARGYAVQSFWKFIVLTEIAHALALRLEHRPPAALSEDQHRLLDLLKTNPVVGEHSFALRVELAANQLLSSVDAVNDASSVESLRTAVAEAIHRDLLPILQDRLRPLLHGFDELVITVDNLDKTWEAEQDLAVQSRVLLALLSAAGEIADYVSRDKAGKRFRVRFYLFIRDDIYRQVMRSAREPDKIAVIRLIWDEATELHRILEQRFVASFPDEEFQGNDWWTEMFSERMRDGVAQRRIDRCVLPRPRDFLVFVRHAVSTALRRNHEAIEAADITTAAERYSEWVVQSILVENGVSIAQLEDLLAMLIGHSSEISWDEIRQVLAEVGIPEDKFQYVVQHLAYLSFWGLETAEGQFRYPVSRDEVERFERMSFGLRRKIGRSPRVKIHPAFHPYLGISD
jgi:hypothetical protein